MDFSARIQASATSSGRYHLLPHSLLHAVLDPFPIVVEGISVELEDRVFWCGLAGQFPILDEDEFYAALWRMAQASADDFIFSLIHVCPVNQMGDRFSLSLDTDRKTTTGTRQSLERYIGRMDATNIWASNICAHH